MEDAIMAILFLILILFFIANFILLVKNIISWVYNFFYGILTGEYYKKKR